MLLLADGLHYPVYQARWRPRRKAGKESVYLCERVCELDAGGTCSEVRMRPNFNLQRREAVA